MHAYGPSYGGIMLLAITQLLGPASLWAAESQRAAKGDSPRRAVVSGLRGEVLLSPADTTREAQPLRFHDGVSSGDQVTTGAGGVLEVLVGRHALITLDENSSLQFLDESPGQTVLQLTRGEVRLAVARAEGTVTVHTPTATTVTHGGLIRINMIAGKRQALRQPGDGEAHAMPVVFTPIPAATGPGQPGQVETIQVMEGTVQLRSSAPGASVVNVEAGQNVQVVAGQAGKPFPIPSASGDKYALPAAEPHARIPDAGMQNLVAQQRTQAEALQRLLLGPTDIKNPLKENAATSAFLSTDGVIISTTGAGQTLSQQNVTPASLFGTGSFFSGATLTPRTTTATGIFDDSDTFPIQFLTGTGAEGKPFSVTGGGGLVVFDKHTIQAKSELVMVDGGASNLAPHNGVPPSSTLFVTPSPLLPAPTSADPRPHTGLPMQIPGPGGIQNQNRQGQIVNDNAEIFSSSSQPQSALLQFSRDNGSVPDPQTFNNSLVVRTITETNTGGNFIGFQNPTLNAKSSNERSLIDSVVRARSDVAGTVENRTVTLAGGVVLNDTTLIAAFSENPSFDRVLPAALQAPTNATRQYFIETGQSEVVNGSIVAVVAKRDSPSTIRPAFVALSDRVLAVLDGSTIGPDSSATRIGLLSVLDSQLTGPKTIPGSRLGQNGGNPGVPPLLEIINSNPPLSNPSVAGVQATSAIVIRATGALNGVLPVDRALLEASAPLLVLVNSTMTTTGHFADLSGAAPGNSRGLLSANLVPGDALIRLDASRLTVNGNLFNLANGASASVTGHLFSLTNGSTLTVNGVLVNLAGNSVLNLTSTAFGVFGPGANVLTINNNFCAAGCTSIPGFPTLRVSGGGTVTVPAGFTPFALGPGASVPQVNIAPGAAVLQVSPQAQLNVSLRR